jgi:hypothetical protein
MARLSSRVCTALSLAVLLLTTACSPSPTAPIETTVTLTPGESARISTLTIQFIGVTIDTRCPANAFCIQAGDAYVALEASAQGTSRAFELQLLNPVNRQADVRGFTIAVEELSPYPFGDPIPPGAYRVRLRVSR